METSLSGLWMHQPQPHYHLSICIVCPLFLHFCQFHHCYKQNRKPLLPFAKVVKSKPWFDLNLKSRCASTFWWLWTECVILLLSLSLLTLHWNKSVKNKHLFPESPFACHFPFFLIIVLFRLIIVLPLYWFYSNIDTFLTYNFFKRNFVFLKGT